MQSTCKNMWSLFLLMELWGTLDTSRGAPSIEDRCAASRCLCEPSASSSHTSSMQLHESRCFLASLSYACISSTLNDPCLGCSANICEWINEWAKRSIMEESLWTEPEGENKANSLGRAIMKWGSSRWGNLNWKRNFWVDRWWCVFEVLTAAGSAVL